MSNSQATPRTALEVFVADSIIHGKGLFAGVEFSKGCYIGFYEGKETLENGIYVLWVQQEEGADMISTDDGWLGYDGTGDLRFLNHSSQPNCELDGQHLYALRDIAPSEELTFDYGEWFEVEEK
jgi:hypothetical protein